MINRSLEKAIAFLYESQLDYGEFRTYRCRSEQYEEMSECAFDSSPFATALILYSVRNLNDNAQVADITRKGLEFLSGEKMPGGIWRYYSSRNTQDIVPDLDDTAAASLALKMNGMKLKDNTRAFLDNRNPEGLFYTWIKEDDREGEYGIVDCIVNVNVLLYLGDQYPEVCDFINRAVKNNENCSQFYPNRLARNYMLSRAIRSNVSCLDSSKEIIIGQTLSSRMHDGSFGNELETALAVDTLINLGYSGEEVRGGVIRLLKTQGEDGSWPRGALFIAGPFDSFSYGSEELTTGFAIEALKAYASQQQAPITIFKTVSFINKH